MAIVKEDVLREIRKLGVNDRHFLASEVREHLGIDPNDSKIRGSLHNLIAGLGKDKVIEVVPGPRKRNRYYRVADNEKLRSRLGRLPVDGSEKPGRGPERLASIRAIAERFEAIAERFEQVELKLNALFE